MALSALAVAAGSCSRSAAPPAPLARPATAAFVSSTAETRFDVADHFQASIEMQLSGEPFAQLLGRNLAGYDRYSAVPDLYVDPATKAQVVDPLSYSLAIESYEYSKQPMNNTSFESGAGLSLQYAPALNPGGLTGEAAVALLRARLETFAAESGAGGAPGTNWVVSPAPIANPLNPYGWPGFWPVFAEFQSFRPDMAPSGGAVRGCSMSGGYAASGGGAQVVGDYECGYNSLNLPDREHQVVKVLDPAALGFATWKQGLWVINYWQSMHDPAGNGITQVAAADLAQIGKAGNTVTGQYPDPSDPSGARMLPGTPGTYLGDTPLEGWQGLNMIEAMHNKAALLLGRLLTRDGTALAGFASTAEAIGYDYAAPLRWWPAEIGVTETGTAAPSAGAAWRVFPQPTGFAVKTGTSRLRGLAALAGGFAELFALTDAGNSQVGGLPSAAATFDGDPFPADDQRPDGEDTPHDRALAVIKVAVIDIDRLHLDPANAVLVDEASLSRGTVQRGTTVTTFDAAAAILGLRTALRSISSSLVLYSNDTPDQVGAATALDDAPLQAAPAPLPARIVQLIRLEADFLASKVVAADGAVANAWDLSAGRPDRAPTTLEAEASAIRGLLEAYLATSDTRYEAAATRAYRDLERRFWMADVRAYRTTAGVSDTQTWTPRAFGAIQGALRQYWKLIGNRPGNERVASEILERIKRTNKLVANGWDDANQDNKVQYPDECTGSGLQMAERALTGELSRPEDNGDRDHDCVQEISAARLPAALATRVVFTRR